MKKTEGEKGTKEKKSIEKKERKDKEIIKIEDKIEKRETDKKIVKAEIENIEQETQETPKEEIKKQNEILKNFFIWMGVFVFIVIIAIVGINSIKHFKYKELEFSTEKYGELIFYKTSLPVNYKDGATGKVISADYNFYFRNDPRELENISFNGDMILKENMVINMTNDFNCDGDGVIAIANLLNLYKVIGVNVIKDENATCDDIYGRYMFLRIKEGNETKINDYGLSGGCYNIYIKDCEILEGTERFMLETLINVNKKLKQ